ncbi:Na/Pi symporter [Tenuibacillus multivorans]|uniref:Phosphate:Na+ symporter n=1 Tax=Tenuibacillus multivorans TaxID=237069 RepID=A0A1G9ZDP7_9BACI|nr:Na/Pi symporter [Tenuibacillus multivorans]GEL78323.1 hypothetical protein TMU01_25580 [Tenuibacillus multivorans]SDN19459.1 phosphate:Na+ symporter [Tenuibacillus multivorans]
MYTAVMMLFLFIAIFLFGIALMRYGFKGLTYRHLEKLKPDLSPINGFIFGIVLTLLLQSSSASIALLVTFLATIKMSLPFAVCYIIGANIGTTLTTQIFVWNETHLMFLFLIVGFIVMFVPRARAILLGAIVFGLGVIFSALNGFESMIHMIPTERIEAIANSPHNTPFSLATFGMILTMLIQSSTVVTGTLMSFSHEGTIPLIQIYYVLLGANIGTCFTVFLVSIKQPYHARITAYAHIWINVLAGIIAFPLVVGESIVQISQWLSIDPEQQIVWVAVIYNTLIGLLFVIFLKPFIKFLHFVHRK